MWTELIPWYLEHGRDLPWRKTSDPYLIWLSEVILQQTRVEQGLPYYLKFVAFFPTVSDLAKASEDQIMKLWQGLGYYSRALNMHQTAKLIANEYKGVFPTDYVTLLSLKGIGPYTAAAISSFAVNENQAVVDGNVYRVLARYFGEETPVNSTKGKKLFDTIAQSILNMKQPGLHNQAMMELGATVCFPKSPTCSICPIREGCVAFIAKKQQKYPVKLPKKRPVKRFLNYLFIIKGETTYLRKRDTTSVWKNLHEPPVIESATELSDSEVFEAFNHMITPGNHMPELCFETKHQLSHISYMARFWVIENPRLIHQKNELIAVQLSRLEEVAVHRLFDKFIQNSKLHLAKF